MTPELGIGSEERSLAYTIAVPNQHNLALNTKFIMPVGRYEFEKDCNSRHASLDILTPNCFFFIWKSYHATAQRLGIT